MHEMSHIIITWTQMTIMTHTGNATTVALLVCAMIVLLHFPMPLPARTWGAVPGCEFIQSRRGDVAAGLHHAGLLKGSLQNSCWHGSAPAGALGLGVNPGR